MLHYEFHHFISLPLLNKLFNNPTCIMSPTCYEVYFRLIYFRIHYLYYMLPLTTYYLTYYYSVIPTFTAMALGILPL